MARQSTMTTPQPSQRPNLLSSNPIGAKILDCGDSTLIQTTNMQLPRWSVHLWSPKLRQNFSLVPRISKIPTKRNIHWRRPQWKLRNMAETNGDTHQSILPQLRQDSERTLEGPMLRHPINKTKSIWENHRKRDSQDQNWGQKSPFHYIPITKIHKAFCRIEDLSNLIHTNQTGAFPFTSQCGSRYIMVAIHFDANYIFVEPICSRSKEEMIGHTRK